jgi:tRNA (guanine37-N1)-methyltransferase
LAGPKGPQRSSRVILLAPQGALFDQAKAAEYATERHLVLVCGRYEGVDQRVIDLAVDEEISIGDYVLCGGEIPAMVVIEATGRLLPGVLGNPESLSSESFQQGRLEGPQYTRPAEFRGQVVPEVLRSGDHGKIARWRAQQALERTEQRRPDLTEPRRGDHR